MVYTRKGKGMNRIEMDYLGCKIRFNLENKVCVIACEAENCEAMTVEALREYCKNNGVDCRYIDADTLEVGEKKSDTVQMLANVCSGGQVIILDNGDLYVTGAEIDAISNDKNLLIILMQHTGLIRCKSEVGFYNVKVNKEEKIIDINRYV